MYGSHSLLDPMTLARSLIQLEAPAVWCVSQNFVSGLTQDSRVWTCSIENLIAVPVDKSSNHRLTEYNFAVVIVPWIIHGKSISHHYHE